MCEVVSSQLMVGLTVSSTHQISSNRTLCHCTDLGIHHTTSTRATANRATECSHMHKYLLNSNSASSTSKLYMSVPGSRLRRLRPFHVRKWPIPWYENNNIQLHYSHYTEHNTDANHDGGGSKEQLGRFETSTPLPSLLASLPLPPPCSVGCL